MHRARHKIRLISDCIVFAVVTFTIAANIIVDLAARPHLCTDVEQIPHTRVALLLATGPFNKSGLPNGYFHNRIKAAAELCKSGKVDYILSSGDNGSNRYNETDAMHEALLQNGVPENKIVTDTAGYRTLDSVVRAAKVFGCDSLVIVTQRKHAARALWIARHYGIHAVAYCAAPVSDTHNYFNETLRSWLACDKMFLDFLTNKQPRKLSPQTIIGNETPTSVK